MDERQEVFLKIALEMTRIHELKKLRDALRQIDPSTLKKMIEGALEAGESKVMITDLGYLDISEIQGLQGKVKE